jgi:hypothetical protein
LWQKSRFCRLRSSHLHSRIPGLGLASQRHRNISHLVYRQQYTAHIRSHTMPRLPISEQAMRLALTRPTTLRQSRYVCRACVRQYHASPVFRAELPFWKRLTNSLFGSSEEKAAAEKRDVAHQNRLQELAEQGGGKTETFVDDKGREWTIAAVIDPSINKEYVQAQRWDGLEWVGSKRWIARRSDAGEAYIG